MPPLVVKTAEKGGGIMASYAQVRRAGNWFSAIGCLIAAIGVAVVVFANSAENAEKQYAEERLPKAGHESHPVPA